MPLDLTHDPDLRCWVESAGHEETDFPIQNLPFAVFTPAAGGDPRVGIGIGSEVLDLRAASATGLLERAATDDITRRHLADTLADACRSPSLDALLALGRVPARMLRHALSSLLRADTTVGRDAAAMADQLLFSLDGVHLGLPAHIGDYTDFYASVHHATNVGSMFRPDNPLLPNYKWVPIGYHGRASTIVPSGTPVRRPRGQTRDGDAPPEFGPSRRLDYELEVGAVVCGGIDAPIELPRAEEHLYGLCLVNDWSARDIQAWEYQPLGPFLAKSFATSVSPWIVTLDALEPFRTAAYTRPEGDPAPLPYLSDPDDAQRGGFRITLEVWLASARMRERGEAPMRVSEGAFEGMYWTLGQMLTHHASNGCVLRPGDLIASGTVSGVAKESRGCLLERTWKGTEPLTLSGGETRRFLEDGDEVILRGRARAPGATPIGFGECRGIVLPAS